MRDYFLFSRAPIGKRPAFHPLVIWTSKTLLFACYVLSDQSGASVAGKETLDLCATSGANVRGVAFASKEGSGHSSGAGCRDFKVEGAQLTLGLARTTVV